MARLEVKEVLAPGDVAAMTGLIHLAVGADGRLPVDEHRWPGAAHGPGYVALLAWARDEDRLEAYAQVTRAPNGRDKWDIDLVVDPALGPGSQGLVVDLVSAALDAVAGRGGGRAQLWVRALASGQDRAAAAAGMRPERDLLQLRRSLPVDLPWHLEPLRAFRPGRDEGAWLEVNNRAFRLHPDQGGWDLATLQERERQPWFDPAGFLLHERDGVLAGFCWTKVHAHLRPPMGEIHVIAVDPAFQGEGLGLALTLAGLDWLHGRGLGVGMLYVDGDNAAARRLYEGIGFTVDHVEVGYVADVGQATPTPTTRPTR